MLDRHYHKNVTEVREVAKTVNIQEHRAPTDASLQLLEEMRDKVLKSVVNTIEVKNNILNAVVLYYQDDLVSDKYRFAFDFNLNGHKLQGEGSIDRSEYSVVHRCGSQRVRSKIYKLLSELIAAELEKQTK